MKPVFARSLSDKNVMDSDGRIIGQFSDLELHSQTGDLERMLVNKTDETNNQIAHNYDTDKHGRYIVPTQTIDSVDDCIIVSAT
jgi:sporulation protein YlmC with PRC-barrel domain